jgi:hypothetical protein
MAAISDILLSAAIKLGAKEPGGSLTANESAEALRIIISMLDSWGVDSSLIFRIAQDSYTWAANSVSRTIGSGGDLNGTRPDKILSAFFRNSTNTDFPLDILQNRESYDSYSSKTQTTSIPDVIFYDPGYPLGTIYEYPIHDSSLTFFLNYQAPLQTITATTDTLSLPPGYQWAIEHNMAIALSPMFSLAVPPGVVREAANSLRRLESMNHAPVYSKTETAAAISIRNSHSTGRSIYEGG